MPILKQPSEIVSDPLLAGLIYGTPGAGKTTMAISAPNALLIDADNGMKRVEKRFWVPSLPLTDYADLLELLASHEVDPFETIAVDTLGRLVERIGDYIAAENPMYRQRDGSLSLKGFGKLKLEFQRLLRLIKDRKKHLIFVAHANEERDGDNRIIRPDGGPGAAGKELIKDLDFIGFLEMRGDDRTISFSPCERFYAKNALQLPAAIKVPDTAKYGNTFIKDYLLARAIERVHADAEENDRYTALRENLQKIIAGVTDPQSAETARRVIAEAPVIWDSDRVAKHNFRAKVAALGLQYDKEAGAFRKVEAKEPAMAEAAE